MGTQRTLRGIRSPEVTPRSNSSLGAYLSVPPGSAICLRCRWLALAGDAAAEASAHTRTTAHPTVYRPVNPAQGEGELER